MGRSNIAVSGEIASRLVAVAHREGKTSFALANEILRFSICETGGTPGEIYGAWKMNHTGKDTGAFQWIGKNLMEKLVTDYGELDPKKFSEMWNEAGYNVGVYLLVCFPTIESFTGLVKRLKLSFNIGRVEFVQEKDETVDDAGDVYDRRS